MSTREKKIRSVITRPLGLMIRNERRASWLENKQREHRFTHGVWDTTLLGELAEDTYCQICFLGIDKIEDRVFVFKNKNEQTTGKQELTVCQDCYRDEVMAIEHPEKADKRNTATTKSRNMFSSWYASTVKSPRAWKKKRLVFKDKREETSEPENIMSEEAVAADVEMAEEAKKKLLDFGIW
jgi:hypothetical protein